MLSEIPDGELNGDFSIQTNKYAELRFKNSNSA